MEAVKVKYKSRVAAAILAIVGGTFGLHRFFLGQWWGIFYLLFCWTLIPTLVSFIESIVFLATDQQRWNDKYNQGLQLGNEAGVVLVVIVLLLPLLFLPAVGILAAIAIPAYQDYSQKSNVTRANEEVRAVQQLVENYVEQRQALPADNEALDVNRYPSDGIIALLDVHNGRIRVEFTPESKLIGALIYQASFTGDGVIWNCKSSTLAQHILPHECRATH